MKTVFAKYNSDRLPKYQIVTKIIQSTERYVVKEALCNEAQDHIEQIFNNYKLLKKHYDISFVEPKKDRNKVFFPMVNGIPLERLMLDAIDEADHRLFEHYVNKFISFVDGFVSQRNVRFVPCENYKSIFGEWTIDEPQDLMKIANVDLIFSNLFVDAEELIQIDYEWVYDFNLPKSYVIWRALFIFSLYHNVDLTTYNLEHFFKYHNIFSEIDKKFTAYIYGEDKKYFLNQNVLKEVTNISDLKKLLEDEKKNAVEQITYRDQKIENLTHDLKEEKRNAVEQITYRDQLIAKKDEILNSRMQLIKKFFHN